MSKYKFNPLRELRHDLPAGLIVFLVAVPLCLGIALASGAPLFSGIISGIIGGTIVAFISGSSLGVSGPAAGLAVIVLGAVEKFGYEAFLVAVVLGGVFQIVLGLVRAGIIGYYFPSSVIKGMLSGIGIIIVLKQIPHAFGYDADPEGDLSFVQPDGHTTFSELYYMFDYITPGAVAVTLISMTVLILWEQPFIKRQKIFELIQGPLVVVVGGILLNLAFKGTELEITKEHLVSLPVSSNIQEFIGQFTLPDFSILKNPEIYLLGATVAIVASLETLLCVEATDKLDPHKRITPTNRELIAQGAGNMFSGLIGGLPVTQVIVRSSANIQSGGRTKAAAIFHGVLLFICALFIPNILNLIPLASLACILFLVGYKLAKPSLFKSMYSLGAPQFIPFLVTIVGIVLTDLLIGIGLGMAVAVFYILLNNYKVPFIVQEKELGSEEPIEIHLAENVSFLNKAGIMHTLNDLPDNTTVIIDGTKSKHIHEDVFEIIEDFKTNAALRGITVETKGLKNEAISNQAKMLKKNYSEKK